VSIKLEKHFLSHFLGDCAVAHYRARRGKDRPMVKRKGFIKT
jgi:hypothetical protein